MDCIDCLLQDSDMVRLWYKQDDKFLLPKAFASYELNR